jgi:acyl-coenzyme A synthetase/AMP-(fatty) acid ligase
MSLQSLLGRLSEHARPPPDLRVVEITGAPCPTRLRTLARRHLCETLTAAAGCMEGGRLASGPMGDDPIVPLRLQSGVEAEALDAEGHALPAGETGHLRYRTPGMVAGYDDAPELSAEMFRDGWFHSGDIGQVSTQGWLMLTGRDRDLINLGGVKLAPFVVEDVLLTLPGVTDAAAFAVPDADGLDQLWAAIAAPRVIPTHELAAFCAAHLDGRTPRAILQVPAIPRNPAGKIRRDMLIAYAMSQQTR